MNRCCKTMLEKPQSSDLDPCNLSLQRKSKSFKITPAFSSFLSLRILISLSITFLPSSNLSMLISNAFVKSAFDQRPLYITWVNGLSCNISLDPFKNFDPTCRSVRIEYRRVRIG